MAEMQKAMMPLAQTEMQGKNTIEQERLRQSGAEHTNQFLMDLLSKNPNINIKGPGGVAVSHPSPSQMAPAGAGKDLSTQETQAQKRIQQLEQPDAVLHPVDSLGDWLSSKGVPVPHSWTTEGDKGMVQDQLRNIQQRLGQQPQQPPSTLPGRQQSSGDIRAVAALRAHGLEATPENIAIAKRQLGIQ